MVELESHHYPPAEEGYRRRGQGRRDRGDRLAGGGFRYFPLAPSLSKGQQNAEVISKVYNGEMLAEALCKIEGFNGA